MGIGTREVLVVVGVATAGIVLTGVVTLAPWYPQVSVPPAPAVGIIVPGDVAHRP